MRAKTVLAALLGIAIANGYAFGKDTNTVKIPVYVYCDGNIPAGLLYTALPKTSRLFAEIGIHVEWLKSRPKPRCGRSHMIDLKIVERAPAGYQHRKFAEALASALPYAAEGTRILVFYDRIQPLEKQYGSNASSVLAYVLAHEMGHVLEGIARHSETGVMLGVWHPSDIFAMIAWKLHFAPEDSELIHSSLESWNRLDTTALAQNQAAR